MIIEEGMWVKHVIDNAYGKVIHIYDDGHRQQYKVFWLDMQRATVESGSSVYGNTFEILGHLTANQELVLKIKQP